MRQKEKPLWWVISDAALLRAMGRVERGEITTDEAYAYLCEHADFEQVDPE